MRKKIKECKYSDSGIHCWHNIGWLSTGDGYRQLCCWCGKIETIKIKCSSIWCATNSKHGSYIKVSSYYGN